MSENADRLMRGALDALRISKSFGAIRALDQVTVSVIPGQVLCLVGENGAGKSTLGKILAGFDNADSGELRLNGRRLDGLSPRKALDLGIAMVSQEADVVTSVSVAENVFLGDEATRAGLLDWTTMRRETEEIAGTLGVELDPQAIVDTLPPAGKQLVQILRALRRNARFLVFDEPTASLGASEKTTLLALIRRLAADGVGIVYVSHFLDEVMAIGDQAAVLKDGRLVAVNDVSAVQVGDLVRQMVGRSAESFFARADNRGIGPVALEIDGYAGPGVHGASISARSGEILGFGGLVGSGRSELADLIFGAVKKRSGRLLLDGQDITPKSPAEAISRGICMLTEDRQRTGLLRGASVMVNICLARSERLGILLRGERAVATSVAKRLRLVPRDVATDVASLSGGNQQKALLARWLAIEDARVFILDEPTKGVDIGSKHEIYGLIHDLARAGKVVLLISSDLPELLSLSDRIAVVRGGRIATVVDAALATEESLLKEFIDVSL